MRPELRRIGEGRAPLVILDGATGQVGPIVSIAAALAPFPAADGTYYPGVRRVITPADKAADAYVTALLRTCAPFIGGAFDVDGFDCLEASFSMVTTPPERLAPAQRAPHFDSVDPDYLAVLHYLAVPPASGTAFFRQRTTGIEQVTEQNRDAFIAAARPESERLSGYIQADNPGFEETARVEAAPDRLIIYQGALLHSGIIPPGMDFSADPRRGRLTANLFLKARR